jgi:hypothetical protein
VRRFAAGCMLLLCGCSVGEITVAMPDDIIVAEVVLREGFLVQTAYLHRTTSDYGNARVFDAHVRVLEQGTGRSMAFEAASDSLCLLGVADRLLANRGTCYVARGSSDMVRPGTRYHLEVTIPDGRRITGSTVVPSAFDVRRPDISFTAPPGVQACRLPPGSTLDLVWTPSAGAWAYLAEARLFGVIAALRAAGVEVPDREADQVRLLGVAVGAADTTISFPGAFGLFDRFDEDVHPILVAIREGLPAEVRAEVAIAAADRNYVNWVRGGNFNPSGVVRIPSVAGDGTGVFGSLVMRRFILDTGLPETVWTCVGND